MRCSRSLRAAGAAFLLIAVAVAVPQSSAATQQVYFDFTTNPGNGTSTHIYTSTEQTQILSKAQGYYSAFDFSFSLTAPPVGQFSTVTFNAATDFTNNPLTGGIAQTIDFRNLIKNDNARVNVNGLLGGSGQPAATSANFVALTSLIGSHELGHLQGLRHYDGLGPIGSGVATTANRTYFHPDYPGPVSATESGRHLMASPASLGQTLNQAVGPVFFGEREDVKLAFNQTPTLFSEIGVAHGSTVAAQPLVLTDLVVPNTLDASAENFGKTFAVKAFDVTGSISAAGQQDFYSFTAPAGLLEVEVMSKVLPSPRTSALDPQITIFDNLGNLVPYYGGPNGAFNDDEFESTDSALIDLILPSTGTYFARVKGFSTTTGGYELFAYTFAVPEPGAMAMCMAGLTLLLVRRRRAA
jgi:hypothetical protein